MKVMIEDKAFMPVRAHKEDAGMDLRSPDGYMNKILDKRQTGKTTKLIEISEKTGMYILVATRARAYCLANLAREEGKNIPYPVTVEDYIRSGGFRGSFIKSILIDDADAVLNQIFKNVDIHTITMSIE